MLHLLGITPLLGLLPAPMEGGFNPLDIAGAGNFLWTLVIFFVALIPMWKVVMGPVTRALAERDSKASAAIEEAKAASAGAERARHEVEQRLAQAQAESQRMLAEAKGRADLRERELLAQAEDKAKALLADAKSSIDAEKKKALSEIRAHVVELSIDGARAVIGRNVGSEDDRRMVSDLVNQTKSPVAR